MKPMYSLREDRNRIEDRRLAAENLAVDVHRAAKAAHAASFEESLLLQAQHALMGGAACEGVDPKCELHKARVEIHSGRGGVYTVALVVDPVGAGRDPVIIRFGDNEEIKEMARTLFLAMVSRRLDALHEEVGEKVERLESLCKIVAEAREAAKSR